MSEEKPPKRKPTPQEILDELTPPARRCMRTMCATPDAAVGWYNRLADVRAALKVGVEVMEQSAREGAKKAGHPTSDSNFKMQAAMYALGATTAIECTMSIIESLCGDAIKVNETKAAEAPPALPPGLNGEKIRRLDLD